MGEARAVRERATPSQETPSHYVGARARATRCDAVAAAAACPYILLIREGGKDARTPSLFTLQFI